MAGAAGIGSALGSLAGTMFGPTGAFAGGLIGGGIGGTIDAIPALIKTDAEKENEKRLKELRRQQDMGILGLTEAEKQSMYTAGTNQIQGQLQQAQAQARAVGAAGMASGAGADALRQAQLAEANAAAAASVSQGVEVQNLQRKRELEDELQARVAAKAQSDQEALQAGLGIASGGLLSGSQAYQDAKTMQGSAPSQMEIAAYAKLLGVDNATAQGAMSWADKSQTGKDFLESVLKGKK